MKNGHQRSRRKPFLDQSNEASDVFAMRHEECLLRSVECSLRHTLCEVCPDGLMMNNGDFGLILNAISIVEQKTYSVRGRMGKMLIGGDV